MLSRMGAWMHAGPLSFLARADVVDALLPLRRGAPPSRRQGRHRVYLGDGQPVLVLPEFGGGPETTSELRRVLRKAGFAPHDWGLGVDNGPGHGLARLLRQIEERVIDVFEADRRAVTLLGLGLSGIYAREVAKRTTPLVSRVITVGTPLRVLDPAGTCIMLRALMTPRSGVDTAAINRMRQRPPLPCTSIYTIADEAVPWRLAEDIESLTAENVVVPARGHRELALHPMTIEAITRRVAQPEPNWRPSTDEVVIRSRLGIPAQP